MSASRRIIVATSCALLVAAVILITSVLPAEYGWDPLGTGETLGLLGQTGIGPKIDGSKPL